MKFSDAIFSVIKHSLIKPNLVLKTSLFVEKQENVVSIFRKRVLTSVIEVQGKYDKEFNTHLFTTRRKIRMFLAEICFEQTDEQAHDK